MLVAGDLGFSCVVLVVLFVPVISFVIRRKWRLAVARKEEIKRLLVFASQEAARAELEVSAGYGYSYGYGNVSISRQLQCAVCFCPTTTRCAQCKAVRYCSGKCQIIHWRQGHKEECHPPSITHQINNEGSDSGRKAVKQEQNEIHGNTFDAEGRQCAEPYETFPEEPALFNSSRSPEVPRQKDDDIKVEFLADGKGTISTSKSSSTSFLAGFSASTTTTESCIDGYVSEINSSGDPERLDGNEYADIAPDILETTSSVNNMDLTKPLSPEFTSLVNSVDSFTSLSNSNQIEPGRGDGETQSESTSSSGSGINHAEPSTASSGFWEGTLNSSRSRIDADDDSTQSNSSGTGDGNLSNSGSSLQFSFNFSGSTIPPLHSQGSEVKAIVSDDGHPTNLGVNKSINGATLSEKISTDALKVRGSPSLSFERSIHANDTSGDSHILKSREFRSLSSSASSAHLSSSSGRHSISTDASKVSNLPSLSSERSKHVVNGTSSTSHLLKSRKVESLSSGASVAHLSSGTRGHPVPSMKFGKVDNGHAIPAISSQTASYSPNTSNGLKTSMRKVVNQFRVPKLSKHHPSGVGSEIAGRYKGLCQYEFFVKLYNWNKVELRPCGLTNCGNSCYANVVLQCLAFTPPLTAYLLQGLHSKACVKKDWCFICEFESLILKAKEANSPLSPIGILSQIPKIGSHLGNGREEDAHEFLRYAIDTMQSVCLKEAGLNASGSLEEETTLIGLTFGGYLRSKIKCMKCQGKSERHERMMDLTVEIGGDIGTLEEALRQFTGTEILDGENKYQCSRCKSYEKAKKKLTVLEAPNVLTIALKRFQSGKFGKLNKSIQFPEILDLAPYMSGTSDKSPIYRLYGVVVHLDIMNAAFSGHYVCYVKNIQNKWFKIDDSTVKAVELERVLTKGAYMLLYTRCSPRAPKSMRNTIITRDKKNQWDAVLSRNNGKNTTSKSRSYSRDPSVGQSMGSWIPSDCPTSFESFYPDETRIPRMPRIPEGDSSSENSSIFSCSDEGSWSTESTRDSTSTDDLSEYIFGDSSGRGWNSLRRNSSDSDTNSSSSSSSSSPLYSRHSPLADSDRYASCSPETSGSQTDNADSAVEGDDLWARLASRSSRVEELEGKGSVPFLHFDTTKQCRKLVSSSCRETDSERLGRVKPFDNMKSGVSFRRPTRERTD